MAYILSLLQEVCRELGITVPSAIVSATDKQTVQLLACANRVAKLMRDSHAWPELNREYVFSTQSAVATYPLPWDFDYLLSDTLWDRTDTDTIAGPLGSQAWQWEKSSGSPNSSTSQYRIKGTTNKTFHITPTPTSAQTLAYEYQSKNVVRPKDWAASTSWTHATFAAYDGNILYNSTGGTTGSTAPAFAVGSGSDGGITWSALSSVYDVFVADTDICVLDNEPLAMGIQALYLERAGLDASAPGQRFEEALNNAKSNRAPGTPISITGGAGGRAWPPLPKTGWGS